ncbi:hypothetical protein T12_7883 [Trichinella patagoniensis]|uniref:Uncharacterized protein n=1 Tax=Trichinella patagoniensis TaxID=990121 RepID=A0A0V0ZRB3_9BILA|nr:hypothetical protein T12_7883 [Trichinella patagoniensis]
MRIMTGWMDGWSGISIAATTAAMSRIGRRKLFSDPTGHFILLARHLLAIPIGPLDSMTDRDAPLLKLRHHADCDVFKWIGGRNWGVVQAEAFPVGAPRPSVCKVGSNLGPTSSPYTN